MCPEFVRFAFQKVENGVENIQRRASGSTGHT